jgi:hypothetical protein
MLRRDGRKGLIFVVFFRGEVVVERGYASVGKRWK